MMNSPDMRSASLLFGSRLFNSVLTLGFSLIAGRLLSVEEHGIFGQGLARILLMQAVLEIGLQFSLVRFLVPALKKKDFREYSAILSASLQIKFWSFFAVVTGLALFWFVFQLFPSVTPSAFKPENLTLLLTVIFGGMGMSFISYLDAVFVSHKEYKKLSLWIPLVGILRLILLAFFYYNPMQIFRGEHAVFAYALSPYPATALFFLFFPVSVFLKKTDAVHWKPWAKKLIIFNIWIVAASFMSIVSDWMELLMISETQGAGLFNAARMPMQGFLILLATMQSMLLPKFAALQNKNDFADIFKKLYSYLLPASFLLLPGIWIFAWFIPAWYGSEYQESVTVFYILYPNFILRLFFAPMGTALFALDQPGWITAESGIRMVAGFFTNLILIKFYGIQGAAWASLLSQSAGWVLLLYLYRHYFRTGRFPLQKAD
jgi:O-antigen/teichoic acid export membrane protein